MGSIAFIFFKKDSSGQALYPSQKILMDSICQRSKNQYIQAHPNVPLNKLFCKISSVDSNNQATDILQNYHYDVTLQIKTSDLQNLNIASSTQ